METFIGVILGVLLSIGLVSYVKFFKNKQLVKSQSILLLDKIKTVCKFITVEGDFAEIYHYEDVKERFLKLVSAKKKALIIVKAKAHIGYDLRKIELQSNTDAKQIILTHFPQPEVLSVETNLDYYDKKDGYFNKFEASDLTELQHNAKQHILDKVPESGLIEVAKKEALETILLMETIVETIGWKLDYSALKIEEKPTKLIK